MLIEEEVKGEIGGDINPDALEAVFEEEIIVGEDEALLVEIDDEDNDDADEIDIAFQANDEGYW